MSKKKLLVVILALGTIIGAVLGASAAYTEVCGCFGFCDTEDLAASGWSTTKVHPTPETLTVMGAYSAHLDKNGADQGFTYVQFTPPAGITLADFQDAITDGTPKWSFWHYLDYTSTSNGPQFELLFEDPTACSQGWVEITAVGLQTTKGTQAWDEETLGATTPAGYGGWGEAGATENFFTWVPLTLLGGIEAAINGEANVTNASDWVLTRVRVELYETSTLACYIDDITIDGERYDLDGPCYFLEPDIAKNVKTAEATFTVRDACGDPFAGTTNWTVIPGLGGAVTTIAGTGDDGDSSITVQLGTLGDCNITVDVTPVPENGTVTLDAEKKWGEIYRTELTAWSLDEDGDGDPCPCEQRPVGAEIEIPRSGIAVGEQVLVQEKVIAKFLPGMVEAAAGGAKITWWLLENDAADEAQTALEELLERFDSYSYVTGPLGSGHGCGQYDIHAITNPDPTFIPETIIDGIHATHAAGHTEFIEEECVDTADVTRTVTETDHAGDPLGEGFTNTTVEFSDVGTGTVEPVIVVVLADYPIDKNGQNAVCVEYFKFTPKPEYKDVRYWIEDVYVDSVIDPIRKMLYVAVRDYDGSPANPEAVEYQIDGPYGLFDELLVDTDLFPDCDDPACYPDPVDTNAYPSGISDHGKAATSVTRLAYSTEKGDFADKADFSYTETPPPVCDSTNEDGYAITGVRIVSSFKKCVDILIKVHDCHGCAEEVIIIRDVMVCFGAPDSATRTYYSVGVGGWYMVSTPFEPLTVPGSVASVYDELPGVILYQWVPNSTPPNYGGYAEHTSAYLLDSKLGHWLYLAGDATITVEGTDPSVGHSTTFDSTDFGTDGWYQISAPYTAAWDDTTTPGIQENGSGNARIVSYDPETATYLNHYVGDEYVLSPWYSYWVKVEDHATAEFELEKAIPWIVPSSLSTMSAQRTLESLDMPPAPPSFIPLGAIPAVKVELATVDGVVTFTASAGEALKVQVFNLSGGLVYEASADGKDLTWAMQTAAGELVANGIYLAKVGVKTAAGWVNGGLFRILVLR